MQRISADDLRRVLSDASRLVGGPCFIEIPCRRLELQLCGLYLGALPYSVNPAISIEIEPQSRASKSSSGVELFRHHLDGLPAEGRPQNSQVTR